MELFVTVNMWLYIIIIVLQMVNITATDFPSVRRQTKGQSMLNLSINLAMLLWVLSIKY